MQQVLQQVKLETFEGLRELAFDVILIRLVKSTHNKQLSVSFWRQVA